MRTAPITALLATALSVAALSAQAADDPWHGKARALYAHAELDREIHAAPAPQQRSEG